MSREVSGLDKLFFKHGLTVNAMNDMLIFLGSPYKSWKTIVANVIYESYLDEYVMDYAVCPEHMCFVDQSDTHCSECGREKSDIGAKGTQKLSYILLLPRLEAMMASKEHFEQLYKYLEYVHPRPTGQIRDFYVSNAYKRICDLYGGEENVKNDVFIAVSTDVFQAFKCKSYDVWPIVATICILPPQLRFSIKNVLPLGFVLGPSEPKNQQSFLKPLVREIQEINREGG